ncbi:hypothetical protein GOBAR_DD22989 [Gossypium barbadense]|nr:hypothetical protein GOBAR_DD22989 [Gossypium barbadense]
MGDEDVHAVGGNEGNPSGFDDVVVEVERVMGSEEREMWLDRQQDDELLDAIACSSSASTASSSSSAASWAVLKSDADEDMERKSNGHHIHLHHHHHQNYIQNSHQQEHHGKVDGTAAALSSTASMEIPQPPDQNVMDGIDCMDVMENFGYMDLIDNNDLFDPSSIFHHDDNGLEEFQQDQQNQQQQEHDSTQQQLGKQVGAMMYSKNEDQTQEEKASDDLAMVFLEWLKTNKETVSAEDLRRVKIKKATIECAARRLGGGKEAMKQLLKLILEWFHLSIK